ncbi:MAG: hypothetical protein ACC653_00390 [Gammaproteobacteria bacterium]
MEQQNLHFRLKELFTIPRQVISNNIDLEHCTHCGRLDINDSLCRICEKEKECFWLFKNDQFSSKNPKPLWQQKIALDFAIDFIGVKVDKWQHDENRCQCHICEWLRHAKNISLELNETVKILP